MARRRRAGAVAAPGARPDAGGDHGFVAWAVICLLISLVAGAIARGAAQISKILFFIFLILFIVILILVITAGQFIF